jgi:hypothetical protein
MVAIQGTTLHLILWGLGLIAYLVGGRSVTRDTGLLEDMGAHVNGKLANFLGVLYFIVILVIAVTAIPLLLLTNGGQG